MATHKHPISDALLKSLQEARLIMLAEEEAQRAAAQRRLLARDLDPNLVIYDERFRQLAQAFEKWHTGTINIIHAIKTAGS